jgi:hypothetical protein
MDGSHHITEQNEKDDTKSKGEIEINDASFDAKESLMSNPYNMLHLSKLNNSET